MICKILGLFVDILPADGMYSLLNGDSLKQPLQMILSEKQNTFSQRFSAFWKYSLNLEDLKIKDDPYS